MSANPYIFTLWVGTYWGSMCNICTSTFYYRIVSAYVNSHNRHIVYGLLAILPIRSGIIVGIPIPILLFTHPRPPLFVPVCSMCAGPSARTPASIVSAHCMPVSVCAPIGPFLAWFQSPMLPAAHTAGPSQACHLYTCCIAGSPHHVVLHSEFSHMAPQCIMPPAAVRPNAAQGCRLGLAIVRQVA